MGYLTKLGFYNILVSTLNDLYQLFLTDTHFNIYIYHFSESYFLNNKILIDL